MDSLIADDCQRADRSSAFCGLTIARLRLALRCVKRTHHFWQTGLDRGVRSLAGAAGTPMLGRDGGTPFRHTWRGLASTGDGSAEVVRVEPSIVGVIGRPPHWSAAGPPSGRQVERQGRAGHLASGHGTSFCEEPAPRVHPMVDGELGSSVMADAGARPMATPRGSGARPRPELRPETTSPAARASTTRATARKR